MNPDRGGEVCLAGAGAGAANENDVLGVVEELTAMQGLHLVVDGTHLAFGDFGLDELLEQLVGLLKRWGALFGQLGESAVFDRIVLPAETSVTIV